MHRKVSVTGLHPQLPGFYLILVAAPSALTRDLASWVGSKMIEVPYGGVSLSLHRVPFVSFPSKHFTQSLDDP